MSKPVHGSEEIDNMFNAMMKSFSGNTEAIEAFIVQPKNIRNLNIRSTDEALDTFNQLSINLPLFIEALSRHKETLRKKSEGGKEGAARKKSRTEE